MSSKLVDERTPWQVQEELFQSQWDFWRGKFEANDELERFLSGDRYARNSRQFGKDRRDVQIRGQETSGNIRHRIAKATERPRSAEGRPRDHDGDPDTAEAMVGLITDDLADPYKGFERERYMAMQAALEGRRGVVWMDWCPEHGPFGEIFDTYQQQGSVMWDAAYHPHHPLCGWLTRHRRIDYRQANRMYKVDWLRPDRGSINASGQWNHGTSSWGDWSNRMASLALKDNKVLIRETWIKNDPTQYDTGKIQSTRVLKPDERYMACSEKCGFRSSTQATLKAQGAIRYSLPDVVEGASEDNPRGGCPECGAMLERIDARDTTGELRYSNGRRMIVAAPFCPGPGPEHLYDGAWPIPTARSFPALFIFASVKPGDNTGGPCDVDLMWDQQVASDNLMTLAVQRVFEHRDYWRMPSTGIYNGNGDRFEFRDDDENVMFEDMTLRQKYGESIVQHIAGTGLDDGWMPVYQSVQNKLLSDLSKADLEPTQQASRDIAVGTAQLMVQQSEVANEDFIRRSNLELSIYYGVRDDYIRATYTPERLRRLNIDGADQLIQVWGDTMPSFDYVVTETPDFTGIDEQRAKSWDAAMQVVAQFGPEALEPWAAFHNVPRSVVRSLQKMFAERQAAAEAAMMGGVVPGGEGSPLPAGVGGAGPGAMPNDGGPNAVGMEPAAVAA